MKTSFNKTLLQGCINSEAFPPQTEQIARHLLETGSITQLEANGVYKCRSLSRRISDIRDAGVTVRSQHKKDTTGQRYVRYVLEA